MKKLRSSEDLPILERIKTIVPPVDDIADALKAEHDVAARIRKMLILLHSGIVGLGEAISQLALDSGDIASAQAALTGIQRANMDAMEQLADRNAGARTVILNEDVWFQSDPISIAHVLQIVDLPQLTEAARHLDRERVYQLMNALVGALEG